MIATRLRRQGEDTGASVRSAIEASDLLASHSYAGGAA